MKLFLLFTLLFTLCQSSSHRHEHDDDYDHEDEEDHYDDEKIKDSIDWSEKGVVNTPIDQMGCGSCWSFVTTAQLEAKYAQMTGELVKFSEGYLIDCMFSYSGCAGGHPADGLQRMEEIQYLPNSATYPWKGYYSGKCLHPNPDWKSDDNALKDVWVTYHRHIPSTESAVLNALQRGPVGVSFYVSHAFKNYDPESHEDEDHKHGKRSVSLTKRDDHDDAAIFEDVNCAMDAEAHSMLLVGYTSEAWILKNSYGKNWGDHGYIRFKRSKYALQCDMFKNSVEVGMIPRRELQYKMVNGMYTYPQAQIRCAKLNKDGSSGWTLANIPTRMHWQQVLDLFQKKYGKVAKGKKKGKNFDNFWIGLSHSDKAHSKWQDGFTELEFHRFSKKQPSGSGTIKMSKVNGRWSSEKAGTQMRIVCSRYATCPKLHLSDIPNARKIVLGGDSAALAAAAKQRSDSSVEGASVTVKCKSGFHLHGGKVGSCKGGVWKLPECE